ncbi:hypothetical protein B9G55_19980 [Saccharibacillus sp. O16]|nr:hypothetical protein B9G55_19980 [Saccharibacillus sp. O16]
MQTSNNSHSSSQPHRSNPSASLQDSILIRTETDRDTSQLGELMSQLGYPVESDEWKDRLNELRGHKDYRIQVAERSGQLLGLIVLHRELPLLRSQPEVQVMALVVSEESRGSGVGGQLLRTAEVWAEELGAYCVKLTSGNRDERIPAHHFYRNQGYTAGSTGFSRRVKGQK